MLVTEKVANHKVLYFAISPK